MVVRLDIADGVAVVTLDRPEARNAMSAELIVSLRERMAEADASPEAAAIVLTGADPAFCAGLDLKELAETAANYKVTDSGRPWDRTAKPVIGAINGVAVTGGLELALRCDFLVASERARFADTHARVGILPGWGLTALLPQAVGARRAKEMSLTGNYIDAEQALAYGLVNHVVPHERLMDEALRIARDIASADGPAVQALLASYERVLGTTVEEGLRLEREAQAAWPLRFTAERRAEVIARGRAQASDASGT